MPRFEGNAFKAGIVTISTVGVLLVLALGINLSFGLPFNLSLWPPGSDYTVKAAFSDANAVSRGADIVESGHVVGQVTGVDGQGSQALVTMRIANRYAPLRQGTIARIRYATLLAQKYIELTPSSGGDPLQDGATIGSDSTVTPVDFDQFLSALDPQTRARLQVVIQQGGGAVVGRQETINDLLAQLHGLSQESRAPLSTFHAHDQDIDSIVANLAIVSTRLGSSHQQLGELVGSMNDVTGTLAARDRALAALILHLGNVMGDFDATLKGNEGNLNQTVLTLDPLIAQLDTTLGYVAPDLHANLGNMNANTNLLTPEAGCCDGGAVTEPGSDGQGNVLRELLIPNTGCDTTSASPGACSSGGGGPAAPQVNPPGLTLPQLPPLPLCLPTPKPSPPVPSPLPSLSPLPCPSVSASLPVPTPSCMPIKPPVKPTPPPSPSPSICPSLPLPQLGLDLDWLRLLLGGPA
jgi:virulence factor Mce-like protein